LDNVDDNRCWDRMNHFAAATDGIQAILCRDLCFGKSASEQSRVMELCAGFDEKTIYKSLLDYRLLRVRGAQAMWRGDAVLLPASGCSTSILYSKNSRYVTKVIRGSGCILSACQCQCRRWVQHLQGTEHVGGTFGGRSVETLATSYAEGLLAHY
jgi:hypothetical protein